MTVLFRSLVMRLMAFAVFAFASVMASATINPAFAQTTSLNFEEADIREVINLVSLRTGRSFVVDPRIAGRVTIIAPADSELTAQETWQMFLATLQVNGYAAIAIGDNEYKIIPVEFAARQSAKNTGQGSEIITRIVRLDYVDARSAQNTLQGIASVNAVISPVVESNSLIIVDTAANVSRILGIIDRIDRDNSVVRSIALQNAVAEDVANTLREVVGGGQGEGQRASPLMIVPVEASNSIILRGGKREVERLLPVIESLDQAGASPRDLSVIYLNHAEAEDIVPLLKDVITDGTSNDSTRRKPSIGFHEPTNALIINADPETQRIIQRVVTQLDIRQPQVLIEAIIVDMSETTARDLGLQYLMGGSGSGAVPFAGSSFDGTSPNIYSAAASAYLLGTGTPISDDIVANSISSLLQTRGGLFGIGGRDSQGNVYGAILNALQSDTDSNVLSTPSVVTLDNKPARLSKGQEIPVTVGEAVGDNLTNAFRTVERLEVGIILEVTPQINEGNAVLLEISGEISSISGALTGANGDFVTNKTTISTMTLAEDGEILVLGGLIDSDQQLNESKVPFLGDIPLAGGLFRSSSRSSRRSTLIIFIRPTIIRNADTARSVTARKYEYVRQRQQEFRLRDKPEIDAIINEYLGKEPEGVPSPVYQQPAQPQ
jgi:general secretion pathway protein D